MSSVAIRSLYTFHTAPWRVREVGPNYGRVDDSLRVHLEREVMHLSKEVFRLADLQKPLSAIEEAKMVFELEAIIDMRHELLHEHGT